MSFRSNISDLILIRAICKLIKIKAKVIIIRGINILISIDGDDNLLILAGWCKVFHHSTENLIIGKFMELIIMNTAVIFSPTSRLENEGLIKIIII